MHFDEQTLLSRCKLTPKRVKNLQQRQRGGASGAQGYEYQRRYAVLRLAELSISNPDASIAMEALCPVDDVVIQNGAGHEHAQCKISATVTWSAEGGKLKKEFKQQHALFRRVGVTSYHLFLVVADETSSGHLGKNLPKALPRGMARKTTVVHVPHDHHPWRVPRFADALDRLLPPPLRFPANREQLFKELNHVMSHAPGWPQEPQTLGSLLAAAATSPDLPISMPASIAPAWTVSPAEWAQVSALLANVPGLVLTTQGGVCCYARGLASGYIARCDTDRFRRFVMDVIARPPGTMEDFMGMRPV